MLKLFFTLHSALRPIPSKPHILTFNLKNVSQTCLLFFKIHITISYTLSRQPSLFKEFSKNFQLIDIKIKLKFLKFFKCHLSINFVHLLVRDKSSIFFPPIPCPYYYHLFLVCYIKMICLPVFLFLCINCVCISSVFLHPWLIVGYQKA